MIREMVFDNIGLKCLVGAALLLGSTGCTERDGPADDGRSEVLEQLATAQEAWAASGSADNYGLTVTAACFCGWNGTTEVVVHDGIPRVEAGRDGSTVAPAGLPTTVEELHALIREESDADRLIVRYDRRGVPMLIDIDRIADAIDDELSLVVTVSDA